ncbi:inositol monophosphatase family protein [Tuanshanicoccus lijuaniae]|uniref:inositol monophosphatase family protein n=1 Tax=Aerococcaceae bacterium zg-1292 TaxID=2774330 RepID=UPI001938E2D3|nr:inositol monophosphatase family protein [Aerococcaceae bacterium zg-1292]MBS4457011.1 inositol monophosphatase family protein [Aerococcaceae bacterium zg-A91]MBS4458845.1 inositol monophosphatase family protein [Aerococcaceae bacterium zg-BR33]QQA37715.1 inositol monophosphatase family protein [Aerococcaceae bacterium zg-1292]
MDYQLHHRVLVWLEQAAHELRLSHQRELQVDEKKGASDLVTEMDKATEQFFVEKINQYYPTHRIIGEEGMSSRVEDTDGFVWVIDPIDGTLNFVKQKNNFGIMVGLFKDGQPIAGYIYDVMKHDLYYGIVGEGAYLNNRPLDAIPITSLEDSIAMGNVGMFALNLKNSQRLLKAVLGVRAHGSAALEVIEVLRGQASVYLSFGLSPWDFAAGYAICEAAGLKATKPDGSPLSILERSAVIFAHPSVHQEVINVLNTTEELGEINEYA